MGEAKLLIKFCTYNNQPKFKEFILDGQELLINNNKEKEFKISFNKYEKNLGKKVCKYRLFTKDRKFDFGGLVEIYYGVNIGYCYIDNVGTTFEISFIKKKENINNFIKSKYSSSILDATDSNVEISLSLNQNDTGDRAHLILINCLPNTTIMRNIEEFLDLEKVKNKIEQFSFYNSYQLCFFYENYEDFAYRKINEIKHLDFENFYDNNHEKVEEIYENLIKEINKTNNVDKNIIFTNKEEIKKMDLYSIIKKKYTYGKKILEEELNKEYYFDFIFKVLYLIYSEKTIEANDTYIVSDLIDIHNKLLINKEIIYKDQNLKIYEKILLFIDIIYYGITYEGDYKIHYYHVKDMKNGSPLYLAYQFLNKFVDDLNDDSNFYYSFLLIDGEKYNCKYMNNNYIKIITTYGFNMYSLNTLKSHLKDMIPNIILYSDYINMEEKKGNTNKYSGNVMINSSNFIDINIIENNLDKHTSEHYAFILSKILIKELFGHKLCCYSKYEINDDSIISFRDEYGDIKFISSHDKYGDLFKNKNLILSSEEIDSFKGDCGFLIDYFFGKIENCYTFQLIDSIEKRTNLSVLLDSKLWNNDLDNFKEYIKLKAIIVELVPKMEINNELNIHVQIEQMKKKIMEQKIIKEERKTINEKFHDIMNKQIKKKRINLDIKKKHWSYKKEEIEPRIRLRNRLFKEFKRWPLKK